MIGVANPSQVGEYTESPVDGEGSSRPSKRRAVAPPGTADDPFELDDEDATDAALSFDEMLDDPTPLSGPSGKGKGKEKEIPESRCELTSVAELRRAARKAGHPGKSGVIPCAETSR